MNRLSLAVGLTAMQTCWVVPWAMVIGWWTGGSQQRALLSASSVFGLILLAALGTHALGERVARNRARRFVWVIVGAVLVLGAVRLDHYSATGGLDWLGLLAAALAQLLGQASAPALAFALGLLLWWRGVRIGRQMATYSDIESAFRWGIGMLVTFALVVGLTTRPSQLARLEGQTTIFVVGFFFVSLLTLALGRLESLRTRTQALAINSQWLGVLLALAGLVVLVALLLAQLVAFDLLFAATRPLFDLLGQVILVLIYIVVIPLAYLVELLVYALLSLLRTGDNPQPPTPPQTADVDTILQRLLAQGLPAELLLAFKALSAVLLLGLALVVIARAVAHWRPSSTDADATDEERDSLWRPGLLRARLLAWLRRLLRRRHPTTDSWPGLAQPEAAVAHRLAAGSVREVYRRLLLLGEAAGATRAKATTPLEHLVALDRALEPEPPLAQLTAAYLEVRYADQQPTAGRLAALQQLLERIHPREPEGH